MTALRFVDTNILARNGKGFEFPELELVVVNPWII
jgi:hypothetical protein